MLSIQDLNSLFYDTRVKNEALMKRLGAGGSDFHLMKAVLKEYARQRGKRAFCFQNNLDPNVMAVAEVQSSHWAEP